MKTRLLVMGTVIIILSFVLMALRGIQLGFGGLLAVGTALILAGRLWR